MPQFAKSIAWYFARSALIAAIALLPFLFVGRWLLSATAYPQFIETTVATVFAPATLIFSILCKSLSYCIQTFYHGAGAIISLYVLSVILYGYAFALIWGWVDIPNDSWRTYRKQRTKRAKQPRDYTPL